MKTQVKKEGFFMSQEHEKVIKEQIKQLSEWNKANCLGSCEEIEQVRLNTEVIIRALGALNGLPCEAEHSEEKAGCGCKTKKPPVDPVWRSKFLFALSQTGEQYGGVRIADGKILARPLYCKEFVELKVVRA